MAELLWRSDLSVVLKDSMGDDRSLAEAAWVSTTDDVVSKTDGDVAGLLKYLIKHKHGSPFEHGAMTFVVRAPIFVWREHHRHRIGWSYNEESGRYKKLEPEFYIPSKARVQEGRPGAYHIVGGSAEQTKVMAENLKEANQYGWLAYEAMLDAGVAREVARMCLPVNIYSTCITTCNPRSLMKFLELRWQANAQAEIRALAESYATAFSKLFPVTYEAFMLNGMTAP